MKKTTRLVLGFLSSLLFAVGFASVANRIDPLSADVPKSSETALRLADSCSMQCYDVSDVA